MRIVSLLPSATEILFAIGACDDVAGVTHECDYPLEAKGRPRLTSSALPQAGSSAEIDRHVRASLHAGSSLYHLDSDLLERLRPDLIVTQELCAVCAVSYEIVATAAKRLRGDPRLVSLEPSSLEEVFATISFLGELTHHEDGAASLIADLRKRVERLRGAAASQTEKPRVLVLEWTDPPMSGGHWTPGLVELAGGIPVLGNPGENSQVLSWGAIAAAQPDLVVVAPCGFDLEKTHEAIAQAPQLAEYRVFPMDGNAYLNRPGPRLVDTAEIIAQGIAAQPQSAAMQPRV